VPFHRVVLVKRLARAREERDVQLCSIDVGRRLPGGGYAVGREALLRALILGDQRLLQCKPMNREMLERGLERQEQVRELGRALVELASDERIEQPCFVVPDLQREQPRARRLGELHPCVLDGIQLLQDGIPIAHYVLTRAPAVPSRPAPSLTHDSARSIGPNAPSFKATLEARLASRRSARP
jgi:hypothetical protein